MTMGGVGHFIALKLGQVPIVDGFFNLCHNLVKSTQIENRKAQ